ncbi:class A basic helix-loop-helix protein 9-like isoform X2 [Antedon mediterranea]|uniref:class A basic helix-loop-helix protein 9-like isoform X2 n=1 Tax=Antedon mediterranea TaxID=105859 RepID=UPI003AF9AE95
MVHGELNKFKKCPGDQTVLNGTSAYIKPGNKETVSHAAEVQLESVEEKHREILQRKSASNRERSRMRDMNDAFDMLRNKLNHRVKPTGKRISKIQALRCAIEYIAVLQETLSSSESPTERNGSDYYHWARTRGFIWAREKFLKEMLTSP